LHQNKHRFAPLVSRFYGLINALRAEEQCQRVVVNQYKSGIICQAITFLCMPQRARVSNDFVMRRRRESYNGSPEMILPF
jgi:hypothetical protein